MQFTPEECKQLAGISGLPERQTFWNERGGVSDFQPAHAILLIGATEDRDWHWHLDNTLNEGEADRWWTVTVSQPCVGTSPVNRRYDKVICKTLPEAIARAALLALKERV